MFGYGDELKRQNSSIAPQQNSTPQYWNSNPNFQWQSQSPMQGQTSIQPQTSTQSQPQSSIPSMSREQYRDAWMSSGVKNMDQMRDWVSRNGGTVLSDNGTLRTPHGETYDGLIAARTGNGTPGWTPISGTPGSFGSSVGPSQMPGNSQFGQQQGQMNGQMPQFQAMLMELLGGGNDMMRTQPVRGNNNPNMKFSGPSLFQNRPEMSGGMNINQDISSLINPEQRQLFG